MAIFQRFLTAKAHPSIHQTWCRLRAPYHMLLICLFNKKYLLLMKMVLGNRPNLLPFDFCRLSCNFGKRAKFHGLQLFCPHMILNDYSGARRVGVRIYVESHDSYYSPRCIYTVCRICNTNFRRQECQLPLVCFG